MSKKNRNKGVKVAQAEVSIEATATESKPEVVDKAKDNTKATKPVKAKKIKDPNKKSLGKKMKESASELKKVSWPTFGKTVKQTGVVILVVAICTLILFGMDRLFSLLYSLLT